MDALTRIRLLADLDRYFSLLDRFGSEPSIGQPYGGHSNLPNIFFVDSASGAATNSGRRPERALITIDAAVNLCTANNGDIIIVLPGHAETISTAGGLALDIAGISVIGMGEGQDRPRLTMSAVASSVTVGAASIRLQNILFLSTAASTIVVDVNSTDFTIEECEFRRTSGTVPVTSIDINGGAANAADRARILNCVHDTGTNVGYSQFVELGEIANGVEIAGCRVFGDFLNACIHNPIGFICTGLYVHDNYLTNLQTGDHSIELVSACTGALVRNMYQNDMTQATGSDPGSCWNFENYHSDAIDLSAIISPLAT